MLLRLSYADTISVINAALFSQPWAFQVARSSAVSAVHKTNMAGKMKALLLVALVSRIKTEKSFRLYLDIGVHFVLSHISFCWLW